MQFSKVPLLLGVIGATSLTLGNGAQAQNVPRSNSQRSLTAVDAFGNVVRNRNSDVQSVQPNLGANSASSNRYQRGDGRNDNRNDNRGNNRNDYRGYGRNNNWNNGGGNYYAPPSPYYPYPYGAPTYNYYYPGVPTTTAITPQVFSWQRPATITSVPLGNIYGGYPGYGYPAPGYGYPIPPYGNNYSAYTGVPYPAYGTTTYIYGNGGSIYSQSQTSGYGIGIGQGGLSVRLGNSRTSTSTTVVNK